MICSLYISSANKKVPLLSLDYSIEIINSLSYISMLQKYENFSDSPIETELLFNLLPDCTFLDFEAIIGEKTVKGLIKEKVEAKNEYIDRFNKGQFVAYSEIDNDIKELTRINIGNIPPRTKIDIKINFIQKNDQFLYKYRRVCLSSFTRKIGGQFSNFESNFAEIKPSYQWNISGKIISNSKISLVKSPTHEIDIEYSQDETQCFLKLKKQEFPNKDFVLIFFDESIHKGSFILEHIENDEKYPFVGMLNLIPNFNKKEINIDDYDLIIKQRDLDYELTNKDDEFIFLLDRSGSMSGKRMNLAKEALILFLQSLPINSSFNIVSFGSNYLFYSKNSLPSNDETIKKAIQKISNFEADLGGTDILAPLIDIYGKQQLKNTRNIFLLTDGCVLDPDKVLKLISINKKLTRVFSMGIGNGFSRTFIEETAKIGNGKHQFIENENDMNEKIIDLLAQCCGPYYNDFKFEFDKDIIDITFPFINEEFYLRVNEEINLIFFFKTNFDKTLIKLSFYNSVENKRDSFEYIIKKTDIVLKENYLHRYGISQLIKKFGDNIRLKEEINNDVFLAETKDIRDFSLKLSLKYQIMSEFTSFICVVDEKDFKEISKRKEIIPLHDSIDYKNENNGLINNIIKLQSNNSMGYKSYSNRNNYKSAGCCGGGSSNYSNFQDNNMKCGSQPFEYNSIKEESKLIKIIKLQKFDGFWELSNDICYIISISSEEIRKNIPIILNNHSEKERIWMTIIIMKYFEIKLQKEKGSWVLIWKKAESWLKKLNIEYHEFSEIINKILTI